ncbi:hypothetical protein IJ707_03150 [bacterium]|nr:hypothetical protein [bacterium]
MGINLNNNNNNPFNLNTSKLNQANALNNSKNIANTKASVVVNKDNSLDSAILKDGEGEKFDSNSIFNGPGIVCASAKKSFWESIRDGINNRTSDKNMQNYVQNQQGTGGIGVVLAGVVDGIINYFRQ